MRTQAWWMLAGVAACTGGDPSSYAPHDPCTALAISSPAATAVERDGIADALALWRTRGVSAFDPATPGSSLDVAPADAAPGAAPETAPGTAIEIKFDAAASTFHGVYDPASASVVINRGLADRTTLSIVIAHELGHVFGLVHVPPTTRVSLMNPGNLSSPPTDADQQALEALWGACAPAASRASGAR